MENREAQGTRGRVGRVGSLAVKSFSRAPWAQLETSLMSLTPAHWPWCCWKPGSLLSGIAQRYGGFPSGRSQDSGSARNVLREDPQEKL